MSFEISKNKCEICDQQANVAMNDKDAKLHYCCYDHTKDLWYKIDKP